MLRDQNVLQTFPSRLFWMSEVLTAEQMISLQMESWIALTWPVYALLTCCHGKAKHIKLNEIYGVYSLVEMSQKPADG